jgi:hypothetical protein
MYSLWTSAPNVHHSERAGKVVNNDTYKQAGQFNTLASAQDAFIKALGTSKPGTKIKLIGTVPEADDRAALKARIAELEKELAK